MYPPPFSLALGSVKYHSPSLCVCKHHAEIFEFLEKEYISCWKTYLEKIFRRNYSDSVIKKNVEKGEGSYGKLEKNVIDEPFFTVTLYFPKNGFQS